MSALYHVHLLSCLETSFNVYLMQLIVFQGPTISFPDVLGCVEAEVSLLKRQGVNKIIAVGHAGFAADIKVAAINGIDVVVGGHSNTFLYNGMLEYFE